MQLDDLINKQSSEPIRSSRRVKYTPPSLTASAQTALSARGNARNVPIYDVKALLQREQHNPERAKLVLERFFATVDNPNISTPTPHVDLLPAGHPLQPEMPSRAEVVEYFTSNPDISEDVRPILACAMYAGPDSVERKYYMERLSARNVPLTTLSLVSEADKVVTHD